VHVTTALLEKFKWNILDHLPYSLHLAPSDFHLFLYLKKRLAGKKFDNDDEVQEEVMTFKGQTSVTQGYRSWFQDLINVWTVLATMLKNKVIYRQFIHSVAFVN
jgi:hypothetical protein